MNLAVVGCQAGLAPADLERQVLEWVDGGWLTYQPAGRDLLIELATSPKDATTRVEALLERQETIALQRVDEIAAYAETERCRHGHLNAYLGGHPIAQCDACDNCVDVPPPQPAGLMGERDQLLTILACVRDAPWGWGRQTLINIVRGDGVVGRNARALHPKARAQDQFGALAFRSATAVGGLVDCLEHAGFLQKRPIDGAGFVLELTRAGHRALQRPDDLDAIVTERAQPERRRATREAPAMIEGEPEVDEALFETLRGWRLEQARSHQVPPYTVFHDSVLRAISAQQPTTLDALLTVKGVGPHKLDQYGAAIVRLVRTHLGFSAQDRDQPGDGPDADVGVEAA